MSARTSETPPIDCITVSRSMQTTACMRMSRWRLPFDAFTQALVLTHLALAGNGMPRIRYPDQSGRFHSGRFTKSAKIYIRARVLRAAAATMAGGEFFDDSDNPRIEPGARELAPGMFLAAGLLNDREQATLLRTLLSASSQMRFNPGAVMPDHESFSVALSNASSVWTCDPVFADPSELVVQHGPQHRHQVHPLVHVNTWKDDDLQLPAEWVDVGQKCTDVVPAILAPFYPASVKSTLFESVDTTRLKASAVTGWRIWLTIGCTAVVAIRRRRQEPLQIRLRSGDAIVWNGSLRYNHDMAVTRLIPRSCPPLLLDVDERLSNGRCNVMFCERTQDAHRDRQRLLRRTYEIERKRLWRKADYKVAGKTHH
ncbi:unnamed protein product (mitochondrion) [Plasmodiophora brassicae]|uniref:Alpha-ketoglutarate-dependent dioxygenase AlkB-like domain-containing protein n=2 Tax=Plasmodiophora brassicae TaxID=37360 RepID=A0A3P3YBL3_PLABS|nr:unnamed protein product [Plasmodiophora brassicae]